MSYLVRVRFKSPGAVNASVGSGGCGVRRPLLAYLLVRFELGVGYSSIAVRAVSERA